jgi:hypothetical protein
MVSNLTLKKHNFFLGNIEYIYERASNSTLKKYYVILYPTLKKIFFSWEYRVYILMGFKSHIEKT